MNNDSMNQLSQEIIGAAIEVHSELGGPGLLESVYEEALACELVSRGLEIERQMEVPLRYKSKELSTPLRLDLLVNKSIIVEVKSVSEMNPTSQTPLSLGYQLWAAETSGRRQTRY